MRVLVGLFAILSVSMIHLNAEDMKVLSVKGKIALSGSKGPANVRTGMRLIPSDKITLGDKCSISLLHSNGRSLDLKTAGVYKLSDLMAKASAKGNGIAKKFASYVYGELTETDDSPISDNHKKNMGTTGSVERATGDRQSNVDALEELLQAGGMNPGNTSLNADLRNSAENVLTEDFITIILPRSAYLLDPSITLCWARLNAAREYRVELVDSEDRTVFKRVTSDTSLKLNMSEAKLEAGKNYYWSVCRDDKPSVRSTQYCLQLCTESHARSLRDTLNLISKEIGEGSAFANIIQAQFAEDQGLHILAVDSYRTALQNSASEDYKRYFRNYLRRLNLYQDAQKVK